MTTIGIFGNAEVSQRLARAALDDYLDAHLLRTPDDNFVVYIGPAVNRHIFVDWAEDREVWHKVLDDDYKAVVEKCWEEERDGALILALVGNKPPTRDVAGALERASNSGMEIRDLAEAGLTYIRFKEEQMPENEEEWDVDELGVAADEGDETAIQLLSDAATDLGVDYESYDTWVEVATAVGTLLEVQETADEVAEEEPASAWTAEDFKGKSLPEIREIAKASGIENASSLKKAELIKALIEGTDYLAAAGDEVVEPTVEADDPHHIDVDKAIADAVAEGVQRGVRQVLEALAAALK